MNTPSIFPAANSNHFSFSKAANSNHISLSKAAYSKHISLYGVANSKSHFFISGGEFQSHFFIDGGEFQSSFKISGGEFQSGFSIQGGEFQSDFGIFNGEFQSVFSIEGGEFRSDFKIFSGEFQSELLIEGGAFKSITIGESRDYINHVRFDTKIQYEVRLEQGARINEFTLNKLLHKDGNIYMKDFSINQLTVGSFINENLISADSILARDTVYVKKKRLNEEDNVVKDEEGNEQWEIVEEDRPSSLVLKNSDLGNISFFDTPGSLDPVLHFHQS